MKADLQNPLDNKIILTVSSISDSKIRCEDNETEKNYIFSVFDAPECVKEGDVLIFENNCLIYDEYLTEKRKKEIEILIKDFWE